MSACLLYLCWVCLDYVPRAPEAGLSHGWLVDVCRGGIAMIDYVVELVKTLTNRSFALFRGGLPTFVQNPDIVEDLFRLVRLPC